jgi:hypothetical protein
MPRLRSYAGLLDLLVVVGAALPVGATVYTVLRLPRVLRLIKVR